eukprot:XP_011662167.1 PREDICTED: EGF-like module-containing mucin-like hormone receptor-like 3 [Strongylocentrotus purpuratus]
MTITNTLIEDEGQYRCNEGTGNFDEAELTVEVESTRSLSVESKIESTIDMFEATCEALDGRPDETITWMLDDGNSPCDNPVVTPLPAGSGLSRMPTTDITVGFQFLEPSLTVSCDIADPDQPNPSIRNYYIYSDGTLIHQSSTGDHDVEVPNTKFDLYTEFTCVAGNYLGNVTSDPITYDPTTSCLESVVTGTFGTLIFPPTPLDQTADSQERCSEYSNNTSLARARRTCRGDLLSSAVWEDPVFLDCFVGEDINEVLDNIARGVVTSENVTEYSYDVAEATANVADINAKGLRAISDALEKIVNVGNSSIKVTNNTLQIVDHALGAPEEEFVNAVEVETPTRILDFLEQQITLFQTQGDGNNLTIVGRSVAVVALQLPKESLLEGLGFATLASPDGEEKSSVLNELNKNEMIIYFNPDNVPDTTIDAAILLPPYVLENGTVQVTFFLFQTSKLFFSTEQAYDLGGVRRLAVGTRVISATVEGAVIQGLPQGGEVETTFLELNVTRDNETVDSRTCVFWDKIDQGGRWSSEGCRRENNPDINMIRCLCDHLTSFAVLMDVSGDVGLYVLDVLGMIGCIISIICLVITLVTFMSMKKLRSKQPQRILINLCFALLGLYLVFVVGIDRRYPTAGCVVVGFLIHFFLLSSMSWMLVEAINMYLLFVRVLNATVSHFMLKAALFAYGLPLLVCIVTVAADRSLYLGDGNYCFVRPGPALYYGVLLIVALLLATNFIIFGLVMQSLSRRESIATHKTNETNSGEMWRRVQNAFAISVLLGLTWLFGFLAIGGARLVVNILFLILNSLQGFFVFLMFCVRQKEVREQWVRWMHCNFAELKPGQRRSNDLVREKCKKTGSQDGRIPLATSISQSSQL